MSLGETIYRLRTQKNLSQGDLAELLSVSRQSISKWENNNAVPDLEKIIRMSEIFGVTLDELVKGEEDPRTVINSTSIQEEIPEPPKKENGFSPRKIAGTILLCMGFLVTLVFFALGGMLSGLLFASPFLVCGMICFVCKENVGLWCGWGLYACVNTFLSWTTGITTGVIRYTLDWTSDVKYTRMVLVGLGLLLILILLIGLTVFKLYKKPVTVDKSGRNKLIILWVMFIAVCVFGLVLSYVYNRYLTYMLSDVFLYRLVSVLTEWILIIVFTGALVYTVRFYRCNQKI